MADTKNIIPSLFSAGSFEAIEPFNKVVDPATYYVVEDVSTVTQMQARNQNVYELIFKPIGVSEADYPTVLKRVRDLNGAVVVLTSKNNPDVYVLSTYLKSFPLSDGVSYEHICIVADLGSVPPSMKDVCNTAMDHFKSYVKTHIGIQNPNVFIGSVPTRGYVSKTDAETFESTRLNSITGSQGDLVDLNKANIEITRLRRYVQILEAKVTAQK